MFSQAEIDRMQAKLKGSFEEAIAIAAISVVFLFLYVGYFKTLHNAVVNIVEASVLRSAPMLREGDSDPMKDNTAA